MGEGSAARASALCQTARGGERTSGERWGARVEAAGIGRRKGGSAGRDTRCGRECDRCGERDGQGCARVELPEAGGAGRVSRGDIIALKPRGFTQAADIQSRQSGCDHDSGRAEEVTVDTAASDRQDDPGHQQQDGEPNCVPASDALGW